jgi:hypothetical protein
MDRRCLSPPAMLPRHLSREKTVFAATIRVKQTSAWGVRDQRSTPNHAHSKRLGLRRTRTIAALNRHHKSLR